MRGDVQLGQVQMDFDEWRCLELGGHAAGSRRRWSVVRTMLAGRNDGTVLIMEGDVNVRWEYVNRDH